MGKWKDRLSQLFDLPSDVTSAEPRLEWIKNGYVQIENHQGIQYFSPEELKIRVKDQILSIYGRQLQITMINAYIVVIAGKIDRIQYYQQRG